MAAPSKKRAVHEEMKKLETEGDNGPDDSSPDDADLSDGGSDDDSDEFDNQEIQVDFEAQSAQDSDFHGIKQLLKQLFLKTDVNLSELIDYIIAHNSVGSVLKQSYMPGDDNSDDEDMEETVFGITSVVNISQDVPFVKLIKTMILERCKKCAEAKALELSSILDNKQVGLLVNERFINIPPQVTLPLFKSLRKEMDSALKKKLKYKFDYYLMISKTYKLREKGKKKSKSAENFTELTFVNPEEEFVLQEATLSFDYCVTHEHDSAVGGLWDEDDPEMDSYRTVIVFPAERLENVVTRIAEVFS